MAKHDIEAGKMQSDEESTEIVREAETPDESVTEEETHKIMSGKNIMLLAGLVNAEEQRKLKSISGKN